MQEVTQYGPRSLVRSTRGKLGVHTQQSTKTTQILERSVMPAKTRSCIRLKRDVPGLQLWCRAGQEARKWDHTTTENWWKECARLAIKVLDLRNCPPLACLHGNPVPPLRLWLQLLLSIFPQNPQSQLPSLPPSTLFLRGTLWYRSFLLSILKCHTTKD
jgi:hypothetical protein